MVTLGSGLELLVQRMPSFLDLNGHLLMESLLVMMLVSGGLADRMQLELVYSCMDIYLKMDIILVGMMGIVEKDVPLFVKSQLTQADKVNIKY